MIGSTLALPVKWGTSNFPSLIASTLGSVDQTKCLTPASLAARTAAVACFTKIGDQKDAVRRFKCSFKGFRSAQICFDDFVGKFAMLGWISAQGAHFEFAAGLQSTDDSASLLPCCADHGD